MYVYEKEMIANKIKSLYDSNPNIMIRLERKEGLSKKTIRSWVKGKTEPSIRNLFLISREYNVTMDYFFTKLR